MPVTKSEDNSSSKSPTKARKLNSNFLIATSIALGLGVVLAANSISIPSVEFGRGVAELSDCLDNAMVDFSMSGTSDAATISRVQVGPVGSDCAGQHLRVTLEGTSASVIRRISWQLASSGGPFVVSATDGGVGTQIGTPAISPEDVLGIVLDISETAFAE